MRFVALDFETSGLDPMQCAPVSLGVALMDGEEPVATHEWIIAPTYRDGKITRRYEVGALRVSGLTMEQIEGGTHPRDVIRDLYHWAHDLGAERFPVVAYNAPFDFAFYGQLIYLAGMPALVPLVGPWQCARLLAMQTYSGLQTYTLDAMLRKHGLAREGTLHGALEDAILAGKLYSRMVGGGS